MIIVLIFFIPLLVSIGVTEILIYILYRKSRFGRFGLILTSVFANQSITTFGLAILILRLSNTAVNAEAQMALGYQELYSIAFWPLNLMVTAGTAFMATKRLR